MSQLLPQPHPVREGLLSDTATPYFSDASKVDFKQDLCLVFSNREAKRSTIDERFRISCALR